MYSYDVDCPLIVVKAPVYLADGIEYGIGRQTADVHRCKGVPAE